MCFIRPAKIIADMVSLPADSPRRAALAIVLVALATPGCAWVPWGKVPLDAATGLYDTASLTYRVDAGVLQQPLDVLKLEGQQISYEQVASSPLPEQTIGTLSVTYPHPSGRPGQAQARFTLSSVSPAADPAKQPSSWNPLHFAKSKKKPPTAAPQTEVQGGQPELHESWVLDIASGESDLLFKVLSNQGFYQTDRPSAIGVQLSARINGKEQRKNWDQVPELNALIQRVRTQGQLVAYSRPAAVSGVPVRTIASTTAYSDLLANLAPAPGAGPPVAAVPSNSPFAMNRSVPPTSGMASVPNLAR
jgi:hypothetical protein